MFACAYALLVYGLVIPGPAPASESPQIQAKPASNMPTRPCNFTPPKNNDLEPQYRNLKSVNFYVDFPRDLRYALECRGHEEDCAKQRLRPRAVDADTFVPREVSRLKALNSDYPEALYPDALTNFARPLIKDALAQVLPRDSSCEPPEPTTIYPFSTENYPTLGGAPDVLNLAIVVTLVEETKPHIVVLTYLKVRQGNELDDYPTVVSTAIPLDLSADDIGKSVKSFVLNRIIQGLHYPFRTGVQ
jgi:hypothetical protein